MHLTKKKCTTIWRGSRKKTVRARETSCWRSSSVRTAIKSIFKSRKTWVLINLGSLSSSSLNLFNPEMTKRASLPMSFFPLQRGPLGLPSWYSLKPPHVFLYSNAITVCLKDSVVETSLIGLLLFVEFDVNCLRNTEAKRCVFHFLAKHRIDISVLK